MKRCERIAVESVAARVEAFGLAWRVHHGSKHLHVVVTAPDGGEHHLPISGSPRADDERQRGVGRQKADRLLEQLGLFKTRGTAGERHQGRSSRCQAVVSLSRCQDAPTRLSRDPWAALQHLGRD